MRFVDENKSYLLTPNFPKSLADHCKFSTYCGKNINVGEVGVAQ